MKSLVFGVVISIASASAHAQTFMSEHELLNTFPGNSSRGVANSDGKTPWSQTYSAYNGKKAKGTIKGKYGDDPYKATWYIRKGKWCENWGSGKACWDMERVDDTTIRLYKKGKPLEQTWTVE